MKAEDFLQDSISISHFYNDKYDKMCCYSDEVVKAMEEYANYKIDKIFNESINVKHFQDLHRFINLSDYKDEILQSIKNK